MALHSTYFTVPSSLASRESVEWGSRFPCPLLGLCREVAPQSSIIELQILLVVGIRFSCSEVEKMKGEQ
jgi:hypothetical protein